MKTFTFFWIILLMLSNSISAQQKVQFMTTTTSSYCKGCAPMPGEYEKYYTPVLTNSTVYLYVTDEENFGEEFTIQSGDIVSIKEGMYLVSYDKIKTKGDLKNRKLFLDVPSVKPTDNMMMNSKYVVIDSDMNSVTINYHNYCAWELNPNISPAP